MRRATRLFRLLSLGAVAGAAGCFSLGRTAPLQEHFVLGGQGGPPKVTSPAQSSLPSLAVRRLRLASYLASPFMVVRRGESEVHFAEFHRWGEPLDVGINRVVAHALQARGFRDVAVAPWPVQARYDYLIQLDVVRFEGVALAGGDPASGSVLLSATWEITRQSDGTLVAAGATDHRKDGWRVEDYAGLVTLLDEALGVLADDLAAALAGLAVGAEGRREP